MFEKILVTSLLALALVATGTQAQTSTAGAPQPAVEAVDPGAVQALKDMGAYLQTLRRFEVSTDLTGERVLADGQKLQHAASAVMQVERPNRLRAVMTSARAERRLVFDGASVTLYTPMQKFYSTVTFTGTLAELVTKLEERYAVEVPLSDLFVWGTADAPLDKFDSAMNGGQDFIDDDLCNHYAFRQGQIDWQIWISASGNPLPRKLVITNRADEARPQSVSLIDWNLKPGFNNATFKFTPPKGATAVELLARKTK